MLTAGTLWLSIQNRPGQCLVSLGGSCKGPLISQLRRVTRQLKYFCLFSLMIIIPLWWPQQSACCPYSLAGTEDSRDSIRPHQPRLRVGVTVSRALRAEKKGQEKCGLSTQQAAVTDFAGEYLPVRKINAFCRERILCSKILCIPPGDKGSVCSNNVCSGLLGVFREKQGLPQSNAGLY